MIINVSVHNSWISLDVGSPSGINPNTTTMKAIKEKGKSGEEEINNDCSERKKGSNDEKPLPVGMTKIINPNQRLTLLHPNNCPRAKEGFIT